MKLISIGCTTENDTHWVELQSATFTPEELERIQEFAEERGQAVTQLIAEVLRREILGAKIEE